MPTANRNTDDGQSTGAFTSPAALGDALARAGRYREALVHYEEAKKSEPLSAHRWSCCAEALFRVGRFEEGVAAAERALELDHDNPDRCLRLAAHLMLNEKLPERAEELAAQAVLMRPELGDRGLLLTRHVIRRSGPREATKRLRSLLGAEIDERRLWAWSAEGLAMLGHYPESRELYLRGLESTLGHAEYLARLAEVEQPLGNLEGARELYEQASCAAPSNYDVAVRRMYFLLRLGELEEARQVYTSVLHAAPPVQTISGQVDPWRGEAVQGKMLLLGGEFGYGDALQYCRFVEQLKSADATVVVECDWRLERVIHSLGHVDSVSMKGEANVPIAFCVARHEQIALFNWTWDSVGATVPYLRVPVPSQGRQDEPAEHRSALRVGLNWRGMPAFLNNPYQYRSLLLEELAPLAAIGLTLESLQFGPGAEEAATASFPIANFAAHPNYDFLDAAERVAAVDVVVTIDSAIAHLAGALGKPCLLLLPYFPCWRWMLGRTDSPWYPFTRLCRQTRPGDWTDPVRDAARILQAIVTRLRSGEPRAQAVSLPRR